MSCPTISYLFSGLQAPTLLILNFSWSLRGSLYVYSHIPDTRSHSTVSNQHDSPLLRLPPELRNLIYKAIFYGYIRICITPRADWIHGQQPKVLFLLTCRQIHHEASSIFYSTCTFDFKFLHTIETFASTAEPRCVRSISSIRVPVKRTNSPFIDLVFRTLYLPRLKELRFKGLVNEDKRERLRGAKFRADGKAVRIVFEDN